MKLLQKFWKSVKRNPVINVAVVTILAQVVQRAIDSGDYTWKTLSLYAFQFAMAYVAREFVVPYKEHLNTMRDLNEDAHNRLAKSYNQGLDRGLERGRNGD